MRNAKFQGANLEEAQLQGATLSSTKLQGADLRRAQLQGASLFDAKLWKAGFAKEGMSSKEIRDQDLLKIEDLQQWAKEIPNSEIRKRFKKSMHEATQQETQFENLPEISLIRHTCEEGI